MASSHVTEKYITARLNLHDVAYKRDSSGISNAKCRSLQNQMTVHSLWVHVAYILAPLLYVLLVTCMNNSHTPGVDTVIDEDVGVGATVEDAVVVRPGGKHPASSISEQQSPKL